jgi:hypothetical protein
MPPRLPDERHRTGKIKRPERGGQFPLWANSGHRSIHFNSLAAVRGISKCRLEFRRGPEAANAARKQIEAATANAVTLVIAG